MADFSITLCTPDDCPVSARWHRDWRAYTLALVSRPDWRDRDRYAGRRGGKTPTTVPLDWVVGPGDECLFGGGQVAPLASAKHRHAAFMIAGMTIHIDAIEATGSGPGFSLTALLLHVNREFRTSAWAFGCLGGNGNSFPLVAALDDTVLLAAGYPDGYNKLPTVRVG